MNRLIAIVAILAIIWILFKGLATAWIGLHALGFVFILLGVGAVAWLWGHLSR